MIASTKSQGDGEGNFYTRATVACKEKKVVDAGLRRHDELGRGRGDLQTSRKLIRSVLGCFDLRECKGIRAALAMTGG
jgi:hypothetical protein